MFYFKNKTCLATFLLLGFFAQALLPELDGLVSGYLPFHTMSAESGGRPFPHTHFFIKSTCCQVFMWYPSNLSIPERSSSWEACLAFWAAVSAYTPGAVPKKQGMLLSLWPERSCLFCLRLHYLAGSAIRLMVCSSPCHAAYRDSFALRGYPQRVFSWERAEL